MIDSHQDWWRFPEEESIRGFLGNDPLFFVGDQPSTSNWEPSHPSRRVFYDLLTRLDFSKAHLTDLYKKRGRASELKAGLPSDFETHLKFFSEELSILRPTRIVALGDLAYNLLLKHVPVAKSTLVCVWHFAYAARPGKSAIWEAQVREKLKIAGAKCHTDAINIEQSEVELPTALCLNGTTIASKCESQHAVMERLWERFMPDTEKTIATYADAERRGEVTRSSNKSNKTPEAYARALLYDGLHKGWLKR